jgi:light-regulated signal transduction histidine kinase (bacteriophytochrome)
VLRELQPELKEREIQWRIADLPTSQCNPDLIRSVFAKLLSNALKYTRHKKEAITEVGAETVDGAEVVFIRDNGAGFDPKFTDKLFGIFQRLHSPEEFEETGVGLATVERIVRRHGWRIWVEAAPGMGSTFFFTINRFEETAGSNSKSV